MTQRDLEALRTFQEWFVSLAGPGLMRVPLHQPTCQRDGMVAITLYRRNGYQAELGYIPQGRRYAISFPEGQYALLSFLGGSFDCDPSTVPGFPDPAGRAYLPDRFLEQTGPDTHAPQMEQVHPCLSLSTDIRTIALTNGAPSRVVFSSPEGDGVVLLFSFYKEGETASTIQQLHMITEKNPDSSSIP